VNVFQVSCGVVLLSSLAAFAHAEALILRNGQRVEGKILEQTQESIKFEVAGIVIKYDIEEIDSVEKTLPAVILPNEAKKQALIQELEKEGGYTIYDIKADPDSPQDASVAVIDGNPSPVSQEEIDAPGRPLPNVGIQFRPIEEVMAEEQRKIDKMSPEERKVYEERKAAAERFFDER
jgi:hypothetical protein